MFESETVSSLFIGGKTYYVSVLKPLKQLALIVCMRWWVPDVCPGTGFMKPFAPY